MNRTNNSTINPWTTALVTAGIISAASVALAEEAANPVMTALQSTTISGYVDTSAIWLTGSQAKPCPRMPGRSFDGSAKQNNFNLDVVSLTIQKGLDETTSWAAGYNVTLLFGPDANTLNTLSYPTSSWVSGSSDFAIKNAYVELQAPVGNGLRAKIGVWDTVVGYEVFEAGNNPNFSRSYGYYLEPIVHTGVLLSYDVNEILSLNAGIADNGVGSNNINQRAGPATDGTVSRGVFTYLGSVTLTAPDSAGFLAGAQLTGGIVDTGVYQNQNQLNYYAGLTMPLPIDRLSLGVSYDYLGGDESGWANALAGYLVYGATDKLTLAGRIEWANGSPGTYGTGRTKEDDEFIGVTGTVDYRLWANTITRLEVRWDQDLADGPPAFGGAKNPAENVISVALNVIYNF
jgi:hypothetical protein